MPSRVGDLRFLRYTDEELDDAELMGVRLPGPEDEEVGGYAYEAVYLVHRERPAEHLYGEGLAAHEDRLAAKLGRLADALEADEPQQRAFERAMRLLVEERRHGMPNDGGVRDQPAEWLCVMRCAKTAAERAESVTNREEAAANAASREQGA